MKEGAALGFSERIMQIVENVRYSLFFGLC